MDLKTAHKRSYVTKQYYCDLRLLLFHNATLRNGLFVFVLSLRNRSAVRARSIKSDRAIQGKRCTSGRNSSEKG